MCGIVGYIGRADCREILFHGLQKLEYRGYDSAGIAVLSEGAISHVKSAGKLANLRPMMSKLPSQSTSGIGHTRWATHGAPTSLNAHPHVHQSVALVHNGIIENYEVLKEELLKDGVQFISETDTEVALHVLRQEIKRCKSKLDAIKALVERLQGAFSLGILLADEPETLYLIKLGSPLVVGAGQGENFFASDALALLAHTNKALFLNDGEIAKVTSADVEVFDFHGVPKDINFTVLEMASVSAEKQGYRHYMLKEIHEQPRVMADITRRLVSFEKSHLRLEELGLTSFDLSRITNITIVACGTAYYSGLLGKYFIEPLGGLPVNVELASEFRYRQPWMAESTLLVAVSQSGETADTLACIKHARQAGCQILAICNVAQSSIVREADGTLMMGAGPEIGVASTKAFTAMLLCQYLFALGLARVRDILHDEDLAKRLKNIKELPALMDKAVDLGQSIEDLALKYYEASDFLFIGRGPSFGIALEGALKLKEISYIHAEGYAGGELKHGPIALIDKHMPIVALAPQDSFYEKMISNIEEVCAREGQVIAVGAAGDSKLGRLATDYIACPGSPDNAIQAILSVVPLQLLSYYIAVKRGTDVDQPRNLAKSVTVE